MKIRKCHGYTLHEKCLTCGETAPVARPPRFSPEDRYGKYRRRLKRDAKAIKIATKEQLESQAGSR